MGWWRRIKAWWEGDLGGEGAGAQGMSLLNPVLLDALYGPRLRACYMRLREWEQALDGEGGEGAERALHLLRVLMMQTQCLSQGLSQGAEAPDEVEARAQLERLEGYVAALEEAEGAPTRARMEATLRRVCEQAAADVEALQGVMPRSGALLRALCAWGRGGE